MGRSLSPTHSASSDGSSRDVAASTSVAAGGGGSSGPSTRNFKATVAASIAAVVESTHANRNIIPGLAELMGGSGVGVVDIPLKSEGGSSSSDAVAHTRIMNANTSTAGDGDNAGNVLEPETAGHPHLPSMDAVSTEASRLINELPPFMTMSLRDSAPQLKLEDPPVVVDQHGAESGDPNSIINDNRPDSKQANAGAIIQRKFVVKGGMKGYRMARATHGATRGCFYYEVVVLGSDENSESNTSGRGVKRQLQEQGDEASKENKESVDEPTQKKQKSESSMNGHLRIGWSTRSADLQAPVGYNEHSYAIRDIMGSRIHKSRREDKWGGVGFGPGDVVGLAICLVDNKTANSNTTTTSSLANANAAVDNDGNNNESRRNSNPEDAGNLSTMTNHIRFFKNGEPMGESGLAFDNINPGTYYPSISCYMHAKAYMNFGPHFVYPPKGLPDEMDLHPISELCVSPVLPEEAVEKVMTDGSKEGKKAFFSKRTDDTILAAYKELVRKEGKARYDAYLKHLDLHKREISALRKERGLPPLEKVESQ